MDFSHLISLKRGEKSEKLASLEDFRGVFEGDLKTVHEVGLILPTYCEAANLEKLIDEIENLNLDLSILVIDDSSPDGTAKVVRKMQEKYDNIMLMSRPRKMGLGTAITEGFKIFLKFENPPKYIFTMDADYSHNPRDIPKLINQVKKGHDLCIGSRYCKGGNTVDWGLLRKTISRVANLIARMVVRAKVSDYTSGMRCYSTELVKNIIHELHSRTYEIQIETIRQAHIHKFKITEMPTIFINRKKGKSKLSAHEICDFAFFFYKCVTRRS